MNEVLRLIKEEEKRQKETLMMIPSENYASKAVREAIGSVFMNKYAEGYPGRRYYQGNVVVDKVESLAIEKAKSLFKVAHVNVQPYSGSPANDAVLFSLLDAGDKIASLKLSAGGHLTHGHPDITFSGRFFKSHQFGTDKRGVIDYEEAENLISKSKPKLIIVGTTSYPLFINWKKFSQVADKVGAWLVADISHVVGLILGGVYPSPVDFAHIITTTTHKTLRGPRGAMILITNKGVGKDPELPAKIDRAVFPGFQGGPHTNTTAGILQALIEADSSDFRRYAYQVVKNAKVLAEELKKGGLTLVGGGTDSHLMVVDLKPLKLSGNVVAEALEIAGIVVNKNSVPYDSMPPFYPSGIRLGTPAITTRGMKEKEMKIIAGWILSVIDHVLPYRLPDNPEERSRFLKDFRDKIKRDKLLLGIAKEVRAFCHRFPLDF